jgi:vitamin B12/bleomycin/antimicrobial peptide transport system ATP-binding/permease protein
VTGLVSTLAIIWRLAAPYFWSEDRWPGRILLAAVVAIELAIVAINVLLNYWNARFFNAIQERSWDSFVAELLLFCVLAAAFIALAVYQLYLNQWLQIRWRRWMTTDYLARWLQGANHYRMQLLGDAADNPDQRIAEDIQMFVERTLTIGIGLLGAAVSLASFFTILWALSADAPLTLFGVEWRIPGYLVWAAVIYAALGTVLTHLIGRALIALNFNQQRFEADFRFNLVRVRENSEQIALLNGETAERDRLMDRFGAIMTNWLAIMARTKQLTFFTAGYTQASIVFPYIVVSPAYFAGNIQLGALTQTASAFNSVQTSLSFFINVYRQLAEWRAVMDRLAGFEAAVATGRWAAQTPPVVSLAPASDGKAVEVDDLEVNLPTGAPLVKARDIAIPAADRVLVTGPTGSGKSTLFRAIAGIWPFGAGTVSVPAGARVVMLPQRPYFPVGSLEAAVSYPAVPGTFEGARLAEVLVAVGLPALALRLNEHAHWNRMLSLGEQQRLAIARAILLEPDYLFLDEATASLDEASEADLYRLLRERLPRMAIVSIGHRSTLHAFHRRRLVLERDGREHRVRERELALAGE